MANGAFVPEACPIGIAQNCGKANREGLCLTLSPAGVKRNNKIGNCPYLGSALSVGEMPQEKSRGGKPKRKHFRLGL